MSGHLQSHKFSSSAPTSLEDLPTTRCLELARCCIHYEKRDTAPVEHIQFNAEHRSRLFPTKAVAVRILLNNAEDIPSIELRHPGSKQAHVNPSISTGSLPVLPLFRIDEDQRRCETMLPLGCTRLETSSHAELRQFRSLRDILVPLLASLSLDAWFCSESWADCSPNRPREISSPRSPFGLSSPSSDST